MPTIIDNIKKVETGMGDATKKARLGLVLKNNAIAATLGGIKSDAWKRYMSMFADSEEQLNLLSQAEPDPTKPWLREAQAYLVSNSICAPATDTQTGNGVFGTEFEGAIDANLSTDLDSSVEALRPNDFKDVFQP